MKECNKCHKQNRDIAVFCRYCGERMPAAEKAATAPDAAATPKSGQTVSLHGDALDCIVGLDAAKEQIRKLVTTVKSIIKLRGKSVLTTLNTNVLITGPSGSGKTALLMALTDYMLEEGLFDEDKREVYNSLSIDDINLEENPLNCIVLDEANRMLPRDKDADLTGTALEYVFENVKNNQVAHILPLTLLVCGSQQLQDYIDARPELKSIFGLNIRLPEYSSSEVVGICESILNETHDMTLSDEAREKLGRVFNYERRNSTNFGNAHLAATKANELVMTATQRTGGQKVSEILPEDITGNEYTPKTLDEVMRDFDKYVGVDEIKDTMQGIVDSILAFKKLHPDKTYELQDHYLFLGNPGTGKTTMARVFADALSAMGILPSGQLVEIAPKDIRGQYHGHTGPKVDSAFDRAMGGVLFIDEAYDMWHGESDTFGNEAVTALIKNVEDRRGKLVVILAGYPREMDIFRTANPGIRSRFNSSINFRDYKGNELAEIARRMIKGKGYTIDPDSEKAIEKFFDRMYQSRTKDYANARDVRNAVDKAIKAQNTRIRQESEKPGFDCSQEFVVTLADFTGENEKPPMTVDEVIATLDDLIGMGEIKQEIRKLANVAMVNRMRMERGIGGAELQPVNIILTGNPGTGKTTIAKRLGQVLHAAGVLATDKVVEREAKTILSSYVNASGQNMDKAVDEAMGGVLFIDEAYNLLPQPGSMNNTGNEALDALMTRMENDKGKFVVVIAGYKDRMNELIRRGNPGLMSRFNKNFHIDDYDAEALTEIFRINVRKRGFTLTPDADEALRRRMDEMVASKGLNFGNAREAVNLLNEVVEMQGNRIAADTSIINTNPDALTTIEAVDIPF